MSTGVELELARERERAVSSTGEHRALAGGHDDAASDRDLNWWRERVLGSVRLMAIGEPGDRPWFNVLLVLLPCAVASYVGRWSDAATFILSLLAIMPFAERLGFVTECLADQTNDVIGGLMNASMGNLPELIIALIALHAGLLRVVQISLLGSVISNLLLVMGTAFLVGGMKHSEQSFNRVQTHTGSVVLLLAATCLLLPAVLHATGSVISATSTLTLSRVLAIIMIFMYGGLLWFQLRTHAHLFADDAGEGKEAEGSVAVSVGARGGSGASVIAPGASVAVVTRGGGGDRQSLLSAPSAFADDNDLLTAVGVDDSDGDISRGGPSQKATAMTTSQSPPGGVASLASVGGGAVGGGGMGDGEAQRQHVVNAVEEEEEPPLTIRESIVWLAVIAGAIAGLSEMLVDSISAFASKTGIPDAFVSAILLPVAGNAAEHASAILFAYKGRMDISLGIAVGSSVQIALFVTPFCVLVGWMMGQPLSLDFEMFETAVVIMTILLATVVNLQGRANWLLGMTLIVAYAAIAAAFAVHSSGE